VLPAGRWRLKYYCDTAQRLKTDYRLPTDASEFYQGEQEVTVEGWGGGWGSPLKVLVSLSETPLTNEK